jgi:homoserine acetyltransferase
MASELFRANYLHQDEYRFSVRLMDGNDLVRLNPKMDYFDIDATRFREFDLTVPPP